MITLDDYFGERRTLYAAEFKPEFEENAARLLVPVNALLEELGVVQRKVASGWRPPSVNRNVPNAKPKSLHQIGGAIDVSDPGGKLGQILRVNPESPSGPLVRHDLYIENPGFTQGKKSDLSYAWVHFQLRPPASKRRMFNP